MKKHMARPGIALLLTMSVIFVVLTMVVIATTVILGNLERSKAQASVGQSETATNAASDRVRGFYKNDNHFFGGCSVNDCVNFTDPENSACVSCGDVKATYVDSNFRYKAAMLSLSDSGAMFTVTGYAGQSVSTKVVPLLFSH